MGIVGPNGAGKSTLVKAMFGLVNIRKGSVQLRGEEITNMKAHSLSAAESVMCRRQIMCFPL